MSSVLRTASLAVALALGLSPAWANETAVKEKTPQQNRMAQCNQEAKAKTRVKVMQAARELFGELGYDGATIRDIAKRAGMSTGAVFANFTDKTDLFEAIYAEDDVPENQQHFIPLNAELAKAGWKPIVERRDALPDADEWAKVKDKLHLLER